MNEPARQVLREYREWLSVFWPECILHTDGIDDLEGHPLDRASLSCEEKRIPICVSLYGNEKEPRLP